MEKSIYKERFKADLQKSPVVGKDFLSLANKDPIKKEAEDQELWGEMTNAEHIEKKFDNINVRIKKSMWQIRKTFQTHRDQARLKASNFEKPNELDLQVFGASDLKIKQGIITPVDQINFSQGKISSNLNRDLESLERKNLPEITLKKPVGSLKSMFKAKP